MAPYRKFSQADALQFGKVRVPVQWHHMIRRKAGEGSIRVCRQRACHRSVVVAEIRSEGQCLQALREHSFNQVLVEVVPERQVPEHFGEHPRLQGTIEIAPHIQCLQALLQEVWVQGLVAVPKPQLLETLRQGHLALPHSIEPPDGQSFEPLRQHALRQGLHLRKAKARQRTGQRSRIQRLPEAHAHGQSLQAFWQNAWLPRLIEAVAESQVLQPLRQLPSVHRAVEVALFEGKGLKTF